MKTLSDIRSCVLAFLLGQAGPYFGKVSLQEL